MCGSCDNIRGQILASFPTASIPKRNDLEFGADDDEIGFVYDKHGFPRPYDKISSLEYARGGDALFFLKDVGFRYYIAGYMLAALDLDPRETDLHSHLLEVFCLRGRSKDFHSIPRSRFRQLSSPQRETLRAFFKFLATLYAPYIDDRRIAIAIDSLSFDDDQGRCANEERASGNSAGR